MATLANKSLKTKIILGLFAIIIIAILVGWQSLFEDVAADEIVINQVPITGTLNYWVNPGMEFQKFGSITRYEKAFQFWFTADKARGENIDQSKKIIFNDAGAV